MVVIMDVAAGCSGNIQQITYIHVKLQVITNLSQRKPTAPSLQQACCLWTSNNPSAPREYIAGLDSPVVYNSLLMRSIIVYVLRVVISDEN